MNLGKLLLPTTDGRTPNLRRSQMDIGWCKTDASATLDEIAKEIGDGAGVPLCVEDCHSIPSFVAHVTNYEKTVQAVYHHYKDNRNLSTWNTALNEWFGMLVSFLLRDIFGLNITFTQVDLWETDLGKLLQAQLVSAGWKYNHKPYGSNEPSGIRMMYCMLDGQAFAFLDPHIGLCPMKDYPKDLFLGRVDWYGETGNGLLGWNSVIDSLTRDGDATISEAVRLLFDIFSDWKNAKSRSNLKLIDTLDILTTVITRRFPQNQARILNWFKDKEVVTIDLDNFPTDKDGDLMDLLERSPASDVPSQVFTDGALVFLLNEEQCKKMSENLTVVPFAFTGLQPRAGYQLYTLPPVNEQLHRYVKCNGFRCDYHLTPNYELEVCVDFISTRGIYVKRKRTYSSSGNKTLYWAENLPYISMWPNINIEDEYWKLYYVSKFDVQRGAGLMGSFVHQIKPSPEERKKLGIYPDTLEGWSQYKIPRDIQVRVVQYENSSDNSQRVEAETIQSKIPGRLPWKLIATQKRPQYLEITVRNEVNSVVPLGVISVKNNKRKLKVDRQKVINISIDFGTSSSLSYVLDANNEKRSIISGYDQVLDIVPTDQTTEKDRISLFHWIATGRPIYSDGHAEPIRHELGKINTIAECNEDVRQPFFKFRPYVGGRYLSANADVWSQLIRPDANDARTGLASKLIFTNLKFSGLGRRESIDEQNARFVFFSNMLILAALDARCMEAGSVQLLASYPHDGALINLSNYLEQVRNRLNKEYVGNLFSMQIKRYTEADAARAYFQLHRNPKLNVQLGAIIVDIGGGTVDISASYKNAVRQTSFNLAGDLLIRRPMVYSAAKQPADPANRGKCDPGDDLLSLFDTEKVPKSIQDTYKQSFKDFIRDIKSLPYTDDDERYRHNDIAELLDSMMKELRPSYDAVTIEGTLTCGTGKDTAAMAINCFSETVKLRYMMLFYLIALFLKQNKSVIKYNEMNSITIYLAGLGSRGLGYCCGRDIRQGDDKESFTRTPFMQVIAQLMKQVMGTEKPILFEPPTQEEKEEVVIGLLCKEELEQEKALKKRPVKTTPPKVEPSAEIEKAKTEEEEESLKQPDYSEMPFVKSKFNQQCAEIPKVLDTALKELSRQETMLRSFTGRFIGLLEQAEKHAAMHESNWNSIQNNDANTIFRSRVAQLQGQLEYPGAAVFAYNEVLDFATRFWDRD